MKQNILIIERLLSWQLEDSLSIIISEIKVLSKDNTIFSI